MTAPKDVFLRRVSGHDSAYWVDRVQALIWESVDVDSDPVHPDCDVAGWLSKLTAEVVTSLPQKSNKDENIAAAQALAVILTVWGVRIAIAKGMDPNRPLPLRRSALVRGRLAQLALFDALSDSTKDFVYFPQEFNFPWGPGARGGSFR